MPVKRTTKQKKKRVFSTVAAPSFNDFVKQQRPKLNIGKNINVQYTNKRRRTIEDMMLRRMYKEQYGTVSHKAKPIIEQFGDNLYDNLQKLVGIQ